MDLLDPALVCPYNSAHKIAKSRFQKHLVKCEKNYPPGYKSICPYNATHRFFKDEMPEHVRNCPSNNVNAFVTHLKAEDTSSKSQTEYESASDDENWDDNYPRNENVIDLSLLDDGLDRVPAWIEQIQAPEEKDSKIHNFYTPGVGRGMPLKQEEREFKPPKVIGLGRASLISRYRV